jgi:hypothetical protein
VALSKGTCKIVDQYHASPQLTCYNTVKNKGIKFHDEEHADPDWKLKQYILVVIAAACEIEKRFNLWNAGQLGGRSQYPDFGKYVLLNGMKAFLNALPYMFADKKFWYDDKCDILWEMFMPKISGFNKKEGTSVGILYGAGKIDEWLETKNFKAQWIAKLYLGTQKANFLGDHVPKLV